MSKYKNIQDNYPEVKDVYYYPSEVRRFMKEGENNTIIFRTLVLLSSWPSYGAVTFGIDRVYIDTSRDQSIDGYVRSLILANQLSE